MNTPEDINLQYTTIKDPLPDFIYEGLKDYSKNANGYKPQPNELIEVLSKKHHIQTQNIYLLAGADEGIQVFAKVYGQNAYVFTPTYVVYSDVRTFGGQLTELKSINNSSFEINTGKIENASLIYLANPNNPSGFTAKEKVIDLINNNKTSIIVIDEAYGDFAPELSVIDQIDKYDNLAVLKSFSKGYGMAGNRVGYLLANPEIVKVASQITQWSNVSYLSVGAALIALKNEKYFSNLRNSIIARREKFINFLSKKEFSLLKSKINAVVLQFGFEKKGEQFFDFLAKNGVVASLGNGNSNIGLDNSFVRLAIGTDEQMKKVEKVISNYNL